MSDQDRDIGHSQPKERHRANPISPRNRIIRPWYAIFPSYLFKEQPRDAIQTAPGFSRPSFRRVVAGVCRNQAHHNGRLLPEDKSGALPISNSTMSRTRAISKLHFIL